MRIKPYLAAFVGGVLFATMNIVQGKGGHNAAEMIGQLIGSGIGASIIGGTLYCLGTRKKYKAELEAKKSTDPLPTVDNDSRSGIERTKRQTDAAAGASNL